MENIKDSLNELIYYIKELIRLKFRISTLKIADKIASIAGMLVANILISILILFGLFFVSIASAILIGHIYDNLALGFSIIGLFYLLLAIIIKSLYSHKIKVVVSDEIIKDIFKR